MPVCRGKTRSGFRFDHALQDLGNASGSTVSVGLDQDRAIQNPLCAVRSVSCACAGPTETAARRFRPPCSASLPDGSPSTAISSKGSSTSFTFESNFELPPLLHGSSRCNRQPALPLRQLPFMGLTFPFAANRIVVTIYRGQFAHRLMDRSRRARLASGS